MACHPIISCVYTVPLIQISIEYKSTSCVSGCSPTWTDLDWIHIDMWIDIWIRIRIQIQMSRVLSGLNPDTDLDEQCSVNRAIVLTPSYQLAATLLPSSDTLPVLVQTWYQRSPWWKEYVEYLGLCSPVFTIVYFSKFWPDVGNFDQKGSCVRVFLWALARGCMRGQLVS